MRIFEFRDPTPIEAFVLALDQDDATELFEEYVLAQGGDPDTLLWRERSFDGLGEVEQSVIGEGLELNRAGLVTCQGAERWVFLMPLGSGKKALEAEK